MKTPHTLRAVCMLAAIFAVSLSYARIPGGSIMGQVTDPETKQPMEFVTVVLESQGSQLQYVTDESGRYYASNIPAGVYNITVSYMGKTTTVKDVKLGNDDVQQYDIAFSTSVVMPDVVYTEKKGRKPLIDVLNPTGGNIDREEIKHAPILSASDIPTILNVPQIDGNYFVRGSREGGLAWYIDGCKITGNPNIPICGVDMFRTHIGFIPARYGDTTGGVVAIETRSWFTE